MSPEESLPSVAESLRDEILCYEKDKCYNVEASNEKEYFPMAVYDSTQGLGRSLSQVTPRLYTNSFASCFSAAVESAFRALLMLTVVSHKVIFFMAERASVIFFAAMGAQEPFSTTPTLRLL